MSERSLGRLERIRTFFLALPPAAALAAFWALDWGAAGGCGSGREGGGVSDRDRGGKNPSGSFSARPGPDDAPGSPLATRRRARSSADGSGGISRRGRVTHHLRRYSPSSCKENERGRDLGLKHRARRRPTGDRLVAHFLCRKMGERGSRNAFRGLHIRRASIGTSDAHIRRAHRIATSTANPRTSRPCPSISARERRSRAASCTPRATSCPFPSSSSWPP